MGKRKDELKLMGEFVAYVNPANNIKEYYDEFENAGPAERAELLRCRSIERHIEIADGGYGPDDNEWEN